MAINFAMRQLPNADIEAGFERTQRNVAHNIGLTNSEMGEALIYAREMQRRFQDRLDEEGYTGELQYWTERVQNLKLALRVLNEARLFANFNR